MKRLSTFLIVFTIFFSFYACNESDNSGNNRGQAEPLIEGHLVSHTDCKDFSTKGQNTEITSNTETCAVWEYSDGILKMKQVNAGFNCCPGEITAEFDISGNAIVITAMEEKPGCHCNCLFDLDFEIKNVLPQLYTVKFVEQYATDADEKLDFEVDFSKQPSGSYCVPRDHYPWGI